MSEDTTQKLPRAIVDLENRLKVLEQKFEQRGYDTRPLFEAHETKIKDLEIEMNDLRQRLSRLAEAKTIPNAGDLTFRDGMYWAEDDRVPFCAPCNETRRLRLHLQPGSNPGQHWCSNCKNFFYEKGHQPDYSVTTPDAPYGIDDW